MQEALGFGLRALEFRGSLKDSVKSVLKEYFQGSSKESSVDEGPIKGFVGATRLSAWGFRVCCELYGFRGVVAMRLAALRLQVSREFLLRCV